MSAPNTNVETQTRRHNVPLTGMTLAVCFAGAMLVALIGWTVFNGDTPRDASVVDGRTGAVSEAD